MYDLNDSKFIDFTKQDIYRYVTDYQIFSYYFNHLPLGHKTNSPYRNDSDPSFIVSDRYGEIRFKDFSTGDSGDVISLLSLVEKITYKSALSKVANDMELPLVGGSIKTEVKEIKKVNPHKHRGNKGRSELAVKYRNWLSRDKEYWSKFGITKKTLEFYQVRPIRFIFLNGSIIKADSLAYCYKEEKDGITTLKIYQPLSKELKWLTSSSHDVWEGWSQMPETNEVLIWTKSRKDVMSIIDTTPDYVSAVSLQAESVEPKLHVAEELKKRFSKIFILYDNDFDKEENRGSIYGRKIAQMTNLPQIEIPSKYRCKDYSTLQSKTNAWQILKQLIE